MNNEWLIEFYGIDECEMEIMLSAVLNAYKSKGNDNDITIIRETLHRNRIFKYRYIKIVTVLCKIVEDALGVDEFGDKK